ncbi:MAG TPA: SMC-Scp complex subunit ScpB [Verrucomicrobiae bacterium]|nr:SMC-Scp complex subunit ScpB [Verrucomicrobiae bacterium]
MVDAAADRVEPDRERAAALEAVLFVRAEPMALAELGRILEAPVEAVRAAAEELARRLQAGGLMLQAHGDTLQLATRPPTSRAVERALHPEVPGRLSRAAIETLAIVAYRQPVARGVLEGIRGVNCDAVITSLERRGLVEEVGRETGPGRARLFGTTLRFLQVVGLERIEQLPPLANLPGGAPEPGSDGPPAP